MGCITMNNKINVPNIVPNRQQCRDCTHKDMVYDEYFIVDGEHYYCNAVQVFHENDGFVHSDMECIDGYWWDDGECPYYKAKEKAQ